MPLILWQWKNLDNLWWKGFWIGEGDSEFPNQATIVKRASLAIIQKTSVLQRDRNFVWSWSPCVVTYYEIKFINLPTSKYASSVRQISRSALKPVSIPPKRRTFTKPRQPPILPLAQTPTVATTSHGIVPASFRSNSFTSAHRLVPAWYYVCACDDRK